MRRERYRIYFREKRFAGKTPCFVPLDQFTIVQLKYLAIRHNKNRDRNDSLGCWQSVITTGQREFSKPRVAYAYVYENQMP
jgi:hypothetical protein